MPPKKRVKVGTSSCAEASGMDVDLSSCSGTGSDVDVEGWIGRNDHPLMNDLLLKILFGVLKPTDLKTCRLVCKKWNVLTLPFARAAFVTTISTLWRDKKFTDFVQQMESNTAGVPVTKFKLGPFDPTVGIGQTFLQRYGNIVSKVDLYETGETHRVTNVGALLRSLPRLESFKVPLSMGTVIHDETDVFKLFPGPEMPPELKCLKTLDLGVGLTEDQTQVCPTFFEELLSTAQNISTIFIDEGFFMREIDVSISLEVLNILENLGRGSTLEILSMCSVKVTHLDVLKKMAVKSKGLNLKHLRVVWCGIPSLTEDMSFLELIGMLKDSLVSLHGSLLSNKHSSPIRFPRMSKLKLLNLGYDHDAPLEDFSNSFPALEHLVLNCPNQGGLFIGSESCPTIQTLNIQNFFVNIPTFELILSVCPNLSELEMKIQMYAENILQIIWSQLLGLKKLKIDGQFSTGSCLDSIFTGIPTEGINSALKSKLVQLENVTTPEARKQTIMRLIDESRTLPSIQNLTELRHFTWNVNGCGCGLSREQNNLTDVTGYLGLLSLKNLQSLNISPCKFSKRCSEILVEDLSPDSWSIQGEEKVDIIPPKWISDESHTREFPSSRFSFDYAL